MVHRDSDDIKFTPEPGGSGNFVRQSAGNLLLEQNQEIDREVKAALEKRKEAVSAELLPATDDYYVSDLQSTIAAAIEIAGYSTEGLVIAPPNLKGEVTTSIDLAFNLAGVAKRAGEPLPDVVAKVVQELSSSLIKRVETIGPFVNVEFDYQTVAPNVLRQVETMGSQYGHFRDGDPELVVVDFSSPNIAKNMTAAHLRSTIIGQSLVKIQEASGNIPFGINHIGDWGTQFGQYIYQYRKELAEHGEKFLAELEADPTATLLRIYREFNANKMDNPESVDEARSIFLQLEKGEDPELVELWVKFRAWSLRDFGPTYNRLNVEFDAVQGESFYEDRMTPTVEEAVARGVLTINEDGAVVFPSQPLVDAHGKTNDRIMLGPKGEPRDEIIVKPSGGTVYLTRDLAAIRYRAQELGADKILYVIGKEQQVHCIELFNMAHQMGYIALGDAEHVSFGHLTVDGRKMSSRKGKISMLDTIIDSSVEEALEAMVKRRRDGDTESEPTEEEREIARKLGISTLIFDDLRQDRTKDIEFDPEASRDIEAGRAMYLQYTNARLSGVLGKLGEVEKLETVPEDISPEERTLVMEIARLPYVIKEAAELSAPHKLATYITQFCKTANVFYNESPILNAEDNSQRIFRANLAKAAQQVINNTAYLLHIELTDRM